MRERGNEVTGKGIPERGPVFQGRANACRLLLVMPAYNERGKVGKMLRGIPSGVVDDILVVDDCSSDDTSGEVAGLGVKVLRHEENRGVGAAIRSGIDYARRGGFDAVVVLPGDDQHDPAELPLMVQPIRDGGYDLAQGSRWLHGPRVINGPLFRDIGTRVYSFVFRLLTGFASTDATNGFRAFRLSVFDDARINIWQGWLDRYELEPYLLYQAVVTGKKVTEVPVTVRYHRQGTTKMRPLLDWWGIFRPMVLLFLRLKK